MPRRDCILELTPSSVCVVIPQGKSVPQVHCAPLPIGWNRCWEKHLVPLHETLADLVQSLTTKPRRMHAVYLSPNSAADVVSFPRDTKIDHSTISLAAQDALQVEQINQPIVMQPLVIDRDTDEPQQHYLVATDNDANTQAILDLVCASGCQAGNITPMHAHILRNATPAQLPADDSAPHVSIILATHTTTLSVYDSNKLHFVRTIDIGVWQLLEHFIRVLRDDQLSQEERLVSAWQQLFQSGIPTPWDVIDDTRNITGKDLLPMIQPVLQRIFVEIKQSLRFGIPRTDLDRAQITIMGPGAMIPRLPELLADHLDINVDADPLFNTQNACDAIETVTSVVANLNCALPSTTLTSTKRSHELTVKRSRQGLLAGTIAACLLILGNTGLHILNARQDQATIRSLQPQVNAIKESRFQIEQTQSLFENITLVQHKLKDQLDAEPAWGVILSTLSSTIPNEIELTGLRGNQHSAYPSIKIEGIEYHAGTGGAIQEFLTSLQESPLVDSVELGATHRTVTERGDARQFNLTLTLVPTDLQQWKAQLP